MTDFNNMTVMAALQVIESFHSHADLEALEVEWGLHGRCRTSSKAAHITDLANIVIKENPEIFTVNGRVCLEREIVEKALRAPPGVRESDVWKKLLAGLRFDGYEAYAADSVSIGIGRRGWEPQATHFVLRRMLPQNLPELDFHEAENEIFQLLNCIGMSIPRGHLDQAISAFSRGEWASANAQLRTFYESHLDEMAVLLGCDKSISSKDKRDYLGNLTPPFLLESLNEWNSNKQKPQYIQGLLSRMHPAGSHAGLSEEDDCAFRLQITLITARLLLRRFDKYKRLP